jgi:hypothetical protein
MKLKNYLMLSMLCALFSINDTKAQTYCVPTFNNGCSNWTNLAINVGTINWTLFDCFFSDDTAMSTTFVPGVAQAMSVESGTWTGCAVYADFNDNGYFDNTEILYYNYVGGDPSYTYTFNITVPNGTPDGSYRMRVIAPWGADGFTPGSNGSGGCGTYEYGNFSDFTMVVAASVGNNTLAKNENKITIAPNPANDFTNITFGTNFTGTININDIAGRVVNQIAVNNQKQITVDTNFLSNGLYQIVAVGNLNQTTKLELNH